MTRIRKYTYNQDMIDLALGRINDIEFMRINDIEFIAEYFGYEDDDLDELKKDLETLTNEQIAGIRNLAQRYKETHGHD